MSGVRTAAVVGTGLIGTSIGLALRRHGIHAYLQDRDPEALSAAQAVGAGRAQEPPARVDIAVLAVPPAMVAPVLSALQQRDFARCYTDVASVKLLPQAQAEAAGCDLGSYVGGHPMAGRERSGPLAARADLFRGRPWVLTPSAHTEPSTVDTAADLIGVCGGEALTMEPAEHDRAVAMTSHAPHVMASLVASRFAEDSGEATDLCGPGIRDLTRIAAGERELWTDIIGSNAPAVRRALAGIGTDLAAVLAALGELGADCAERREAARTELGRMLGRGVSGRQRIAGPSGNSWQDCRTVSVVVDQGDRSMPRLLADADRCGIGVAEVRLEQEPGRDVRAPEGRADVLVAVKSAPELVAALRSYGWVAWG